MKNADSLLLRLPAEVKNRIYAFVIGDQFLHIKRYHRDRKNFVIHSCQLSIARRRPWRSSGKRSVFASRRLEPEYVRNHFECYDAWPGTSELGQDLMTQSIRRIIQTCRQIYHEMNYTYWASSTFSFETVYTLLDFVKHIKRAPYLELIWIQRLHLDFWIYDESSLAACEQALRMIPKRLRNVKDVSLSIEHLSCVRPETWTHVHDLLNDLSKITRLSFVAFK